MSRIQIPDRLTGLLEGGELQGPIQTFADKVAEILVDNKMPFFPGYTDHGVEHVTRVLNSIVDLIPGDVWERSAPGLTNPLLCDVDVALIIGGVLLHDFAMHIRPHGFLELLETNTRFQPLPWFSESHPGLSQDFKWKDLWHEYLREARRFSARQLSDIIGEDSARDWKFSDLPSQTAKWELNHYLVVGEFMRRHHGRLAHEIAIYGFPGLVAGSGDGQFPALGRGQDTPLTHLADLIGLVARSHTISLRLAKAYLDSSPLYSGTPRPLGSAVLYPMALLRVADYLQIDRKRAPAVLLNLRNPQSPVSVREWEKHRAVQVVVPATDPRGKMVTANAEITLPVYLQLLDLIKALQEELDHSTAVLDETYGNLREQGLDKLNLAIRRIYSNLEDPTFVDKLPYIPTRAGFSADPNLLTLLVEPLYGKQPAVGVRELLQNAVDAVSELHQWAASRNLAVNNLGVTEQDFDVCIDFIERDNQTWVLRVRDNGIGMTPQIIQNYFLRAGASFRNSALWADEFLDESGKPRVLRAGRFGVGAFAIFLLGPTFRMWTRRVNTDPSDGYMIAASTASQLIEIKHSESLPVGTTIEVDVTPESADALGLTKNASAPSALESWDWFCWDWPKVVRRITRNNEMVTIPQMHSLPILKGELGPAWSSIRPNGFESVYWTFDKAPKLSCNGITISEFDLFWRDPDVSWPDNIGLKAPNIAVVDPSANLPLDVRRFTLSHQTIPFRDELLNDVMLSFIAHCLICGPKSPEEALSSRSPYPLRRTWYTLLRDGTWAFHDGLLRWCVTSNEMVPLDPWLLSLLRKSACILYGAFLPDISLADAGPMLSDSNLLRKLANSGDAIISWYILGDYSTIYDPVSDSRFGNFDDQVQENLEDLVKEGITTFHPQGNVEELFARLNSYLREDEQAYWRDDTFDYTWSKITLSNSKHEWYRLSKVQTPVSAKTKGLLTKIESVANRFEDHHGSGWDDRDAVFLARIGLPEERSLPQTILATIWNECLGPHPIPFDPTEREKLIAYGRQNQSLSRHIDSWEELKKRGFK